MSGIPAYALGISQESVARWLFGRDGRAAPPPAEGEPVPLAYFVFLRVQPILGVSIHRLLERDPDRGLFGGVAYRAQRPVRVGERLSASAVMTEKKQVRGASGVLSLSTLANTYRNGAGTVLTETVRLVDLPPGPAQPPARGPQRPSPHPKLYEFAPLTRTQIAWLAVETGDMNPLHLDPEYARSRHYPEVVVPGTLLAALAEREAARVLGGALAELEIRLHAPSYPKEPLAMHGTVGAQGLEFEILCRSELRVSGRARALDGGR